MPRESRGSGTAAKTVSATLPPQAAPRSRIRSSIACLCRPAASRSFSSRSRCSAAFRSRSFRARRRFSSCRAFRRARPSSRSCSPRTILSAAASTALSAQAGADMEE